MRVAIVVAGALMIMGGCRQEAPSGRAADAALPPVNLSSPEAAAKTVLATIQAELAAAARRDPAGVAGARDQLLLIAATDVIRNRWPVDAPGLATRERAPRLVTQSWSAGIQYYADGLDLDGLRLATSTKTTAQLTVPARGASGRALIRIECAAVGNEWRIARIDFAGPSAASQPASEASSQPG